jgi:hypothetical protein
MAAYKACAEAAERGENSQRACAALSTTRETATVTSLRAERVRRAQLSRRRQPITAGRPWIDIPPSTAMHWPVT